MSGPLAPAAALAYNGAAATAAFYGAPVGTAFGISAAGTIGSIGAAGAVESIFTLLALCHGVLPPTINYQHPDPECDLDYVPNKARRWTPSAAMSNSFGLGGHNATVIFRPFEPSRAL